MNSSCRGVITYKRNNIRNQVMCEAQTTLVENKQATNSLDESDWYFSKAIFRVESEWCWGQHHFALFSLNCKLFGIYEKKFLIQSKSQISSEKDIKYGSGFGLKEVSLPVVLILTFLLQYIYSSGFSLVGRLEISLPVGNIERNRKRCLFHNKSFYIAQEDWDTLSCRGKQYTLLHQQCAFNRTHGLPLLCTFV